MDRPADFDSWTINERIKYLHTIEKLSTFQICAIVNRGMQHVCNIISNGFPPNKRGNKRLGDPGHSGTVAVTKDDRRDYVRHLKYGITLLEYTTKLETQQHRCMICQDEFTEPPHIDHIHGTRPPILRDLLCLNCNTALGKFRDNPEILTRAIRYLNWHATKLATCPAS